MAKVTNISGEDMELVLYDDQDNHTRITILDATQEVIEDKYVFGRGDVLKLVVLGKLTLDEAPAGFGANAGYVPATSGDWVGDPTSIAEAIDRIAAEVAILKTSAIS